MNVDLKDGELALIEDSIFRDVKARLNILAKADIEFHPDLDEVASQLRLINQIISIENKIWEARGHRLTDTLE